MKSRRTPGRLRLDGGTVPDGCIPQPPAEVLPVEGLIPSQLRALLQMDTRCRGKLASHGIVVLRENEAMRVEYLGAVGRAMGQAVPAAACPLGG